MPFGRGRGNKHITSSYASTVTMIIFVALCAIAVWMISTNTFVPPQIMRVSTNANDETRSEKSESDEQPAFEDNPGKLPDDAIKADVEEQRKAKVGEESIVAQKQETKQSDEKKEKEDKSGFVEKSKDIVEEKAVQESDQGKAKQVVKEYEKEQKEQREEDTGNQSESSKDMDQGKKQEQDAKQGQEADSNADVTFTDSTKREEPTEQGFMKAAGKGETSENIKKEDENGQQEKEPNNGDEEKKVKDDDKRKKQNDKDAVNEENVKETEENGQGEENVKETEDSGKGEESGQQQEEQNTGIEEKDDKTNEQNENGAVTEVKETEDGSGDTRKEDNATEENQESGAEGRGFGSGIRKESEESHKSWKTQAIESKDEKQRQKKDNNAERVAMGEKAWLLCNVTSGTDYIPCLDNEEAIMKLKSRSHFEHRERHCPEDSPTCLVPLPEGYKESIKWPESRDKIWYHNVPHTKLAEVKGHQNWVKVTGEFLTFPGGGTQFIHGALHYIDFLQQSLKHIGWGKHTRVVLDVGCGVASFGGFLFERDVLAMSFAPKDEHEAQVQFALERNIPAISAVMGSTRLPFPSRVFDLIHCARCRVPWHNEGGLLLLELNRMLRPGGYFVWSATPVYQKLEEDVEIWKAMSSLTKSLCWELVTINKDKLNHIGAAIYRKPSTNECYEKRQQKEPPMCKNDDDPDAAWHVPLQACMHKVPTDPVKRGSKWPKDWPRRLQTAPYWLNSSQMGIYGKPAPQDFTTDYEHWKEVVNKVYKKELGIKWSNVRNVMDMRAVYGGFAAALKDLKVWVMNVVNINSPDTLPIIYERGLFGIYHDWCESFSTYPRSYDLLHADHLFSKLKVRCNLVPVMAEVDRIVRPGGKLIVRDESNVIREVENLLKSLHWDVHLTFSKNQEGILSAQKGFWRPEKYQTSS